MAAALTVEALILVIDLLTQNTSFLTFYGIVSDFCSSPFFFCVGVRYGGL